MPVAVVTDTTNYLPGPLLERLGVPAVSLYVTHGEHQVREADITDLPAFYEELRAGTDLPSTSQPSVGDFLAAYEPLLEAGSDVVSIHLAGGISGTADSARQAAVEAERRHAGRSVRVIDSTTACGGLGGVVLAARAAAQDATDVDVVVARAEEAVRAMEIWFAVDTLEFLRRGGRIGGAQAWLGGALRIKPILTVRGAIEPVERVRTSRRAFERMVRYMHERLADGADAWMVQHIQAPEEVERLAARGREIFGTEPIVISEVGPVIGAHVGPGLLGVGALPSALLEGLPAA